MGDTLQWNDRERRYISTSIPYVNGKPHIGTALEFVFGDVMARYWRSQLGTENVHFSIGTDEHGQKIATKAEERGVEPRELVDEMTTHFQKMADVMQVSYNDYIRTTEERHETVVHAIWERLLERGYVYKGEYTGLYCVGCEEYKLEKDLVNGCCSIHETEPVTINEENYFFKLSAFEQQLKELYAVNPTFVYPAHRRKEMLQIIESGLADVSITRERKNMSWGVAVPGDKEHVMYVWFEAVMNYITTAGYGTDAFDKWWPAALHIIGKDINRFHSIMWPAMLMAADIPVPERIGVHGFISVDGRKMSKSLGNVIDPIELVNTYGVDAVRYFLLREIPFEDDGDFSWERFGVRYKSDLQDGIGNLLSRVTNLVEKYFDGKVEARLQDAYADIFDASAWSHAVEQLDFRAALEQVWALVDHGNVYVNDHQPWKLIKEDEEKTREVLAHLLAVLDLIASYSEPFMPQMSATVSSVLHADSINKAEPLFPRIEQ